MVVLQALGYLQNVKCKSYIPNSYSQHIAVPHIPYIYYQQKSALQIPHVDLVQKYLSQIYSGVVKYSSSQPLNQISILFKIMNEQNLQPNFQAPSQATHLLGS